MSVVFDSSAVFAITFGEHSADRAADALGDVYFSLVNASEVVAHLVEAAVLTADRSWGSSNSSSKVEFIR